MTIRNGPAVKKNENQQEPGLSHDILMLQLVSILFAVILQKITRDLKCASNDPINLMQLASQTSLSTSVIDRIGFSQPLVMLQLHGIN